MRCSTGQALYDKHQTEANGAKLANAAVEQFHATTEQEFSDELVAAQKPIQAETNEHSAWTEHKKACSDCRAA